MSQEEAQKLAKKLFKLEDLEKWGWALGFHSDQDTEGKNLGLCQYLKHQITLNSSKLRSASYQRVKTTLLHEMAHAIMPMGLGHNEEWQAHLERITRANFKREDQETKVAQVITP